MFGKCVTIFLNSCPVMTEEIIVNELRKLFWQRGECEGWLIQIM